MYYVSIYFDEKTNYRIQQYINAVAKKTGNDFMIQEKVPPHITITAFETKQENSVLAVLENCFGQLKKGEVQWASVGAFLPHVIYIAPILNKYLHRMSKEICADLESLEEVSISSYYRPLQWLPHTTIGKKLSKEEMGISFEVLQNQFGMFQGEVRKIGLAKTNPYEDILLWELEVGQCVCL